jgi:hypothetical protein
MGETKEKLEKVLTGIDLPGRVHLGSNKIEITFEISESDRLNLDIEQKIIGVMDFVKQLVLDEDYFGGEINKELIANQSYTDKMKTKMFKIGIKFEERLMNKTFIDIYAKKILRGVLFGGYQSKVIHLIDDKKMHLFYSKNDNFHNFLFGSFEKLHLVLEDEATGAVAVHEIDGPRGTPLKFFEMSPIDIKNCKIKHFSMISLDGEFYDKSD